MKVRNTFGVSLIMSHVEPYYSEKWQEWGDYYLLGSFDGLQIQVTEDNVLEFSTSLPKNLSEYNNAGNRMLFQPTVQKQFFCVQEKDNIHWTKRERLKEYANSNGKPFILLFAIKLHPQYIKYPRCSDDICKCVETQFINHMISERIKNDNFECFAMRALSADDMYILVGMDKPWYGEAMEFSLKLNAWTCMFDCNAAMSDKKSYFDNLVKRLYQLKEEENDNNLWLINNEDIINILQKEITNNLKYLGEEKIELLTKPFYSEWENTCENEKVEYKKIQWLSECFNTIRLFGAVPVVLQTYSMVGYSKSIFQSNDPNSGKLILEKTGFPEKELCEDNSEDHKYTDIYLDFRMSVRPGTTVDFAANFEKNLTEVADEATRCYQEYVHKLDKHKAFPNGFDLSALKRDVYMTVGQYDYAWNEKVNPVELLYIYTKLFRKRINKCDLMFCQQRIYGRLAIKANVAASNIIPAYMEEDAILNRYWAEEQQRSVEGFFALFNIKNADDNEELQILKSNVKSESVRKIIDRVIKENRLKKIIKQVEKDRYLKQLIDELSMLHIQGCKSFYKAASWLEFGDARKFFVSFYEQLKKIFIDDLYSDDYKDFDEELLSDIKYSLMVGIDILAQLFHDRMVLDMSMRENTRPEIYAAGAYERLIKSHSKCIDYIIHLLKVIEKNSTADNKQNNKQYVPIDDLGFIISPSDRDTPKSVSLFPLRFQGAGRLSVYWAPLEEMLQYHISLLTHGHEIGHYYGILNRDIRIKICLKMCCYLFAQRLGNELRKLSHHKLHKLALQRQVKNVEEEMYNYLNKETSYVSNKYMHHIEHRCKYAIERFINNPFNPDTPEMTNLLSAMAELYKAAGMSTMINSESRMFGQLIKEIFFDDVLELTKLIIREITADLTAICIFDISGDKFVEWFMDILDIDSTTQRVNRNEEENKQDYGIFAMRILSALMITSDYTKEKSTSGENILISYEMAKGNYLQESVDKAIQIARSKNNDDLADALGCVDNRSVI